MPYGRWLVIAMVFGQVLYAFLLTIGLALTMRQNPFVLPGFWENYIYGSVAINIAFAVVLVPYVVIWTIRVSPTTLRGFNAWGVFATVSWDSIHTVKPWRVPFLPAVRVYSSETNLVIWLPLFLVNYPEFARRVVEYAGPEHPLTQPVLSQLDPEEPLT